MLFRVLLLMLSRGAGQFAEAFGRAALHAGFEDSIANQAEKTQASMFGSVTLHLGGEDRSRRGKGMLIQDLGCRADAQEESANPREICCHWGSSF